MKAVNLILGTLICYNIGTIAAHVSTSENFIFENLGKYQVNPSYIKISRRVNLNSTRKLLEKLNNVEQKYKNYCNKKEPIDYVRKTKNWVLLDKQFNSSKEAASYCWENYFAKLP